MGCSLAKTVLAAAAACAMFSGSVVAQGVAAPAVKGLDAVDSLVTAEFAKDSIGSITVGVVSGSRLVWTRTAGFADMKTRRLANRQTVYRIGSITKPFTAVMLLQQVAAGRVALSDPVERYLPQVKQIGNRPKGAAPFTFLQLATMTAGLAREPEEPAPFLTGSVATWEKTLFAALPHTRYISTPGTEYSYSNIGYATLGAALARVAHQPYIDWERSHIFQPLGMTRTRFEVDATIASDLAVGYEVNGDGKLDDTTSAREARDGRGYKVPNGAIFTTVDDLARFVSFELGMGPDSVLPRNMLDDAYGGLVATDRGMESGYGLGFMAISQNGYQYVGHSGSVAGYRAAMYYDRPRKLGVVLLRNAGGGKQEPDALAVKILSSLAAKKVAEIEADITERFKTQVASPGSEAAVRRLIGELCAGKPSYDLMSADMSRETRRQLAQHKATFARLGALQSVKFSGAGRGGANIYLTTFDKGTLEWRVWMNLDGTVDVFRYREMAR